MGHYVCKCGHVNLDIEVMSDGCCQKCERPIVHTLDPLVVLLVCRKRGCPRQLKPMKIPRDDIMPKGTAAVVQDCPWHMDHGAKAYYVEYYDANGKRLYEE